MINYNPKDWFGLIFKFHKSDTFRKLFWVIISLAGYSLILAYLEIEVYQLDFKSTPALHSILGFVLSILLVFRTNTAYDRWWEGRRLWGGLVNNSRSLSLKLKSLVQTEPSQTYKELQEWIALYPSVLTQHLRSKKALDKRIPEAVHQPNFVHGKIHQLVQTFKKEEQLSDTHLLFLDTELRAYSDICGACERIKNTPIPYSYSLFLKKFIFIYIMTMPYGFIKEFGYGIILATTFVFYVLASLELIAEEIENPFGEDANDLDLEQITETIEKNIREIA
jgi:ion channel-forming bestrophin family protein